MQTSNLTSKHQTEKEKRRWGSVDECMTPCINNGTSEEKSLSLLGEGIEGFEVVNDGKFWLPSYLKKEYMNNFLQLNQDPEKYPQCVNAKNW